MKIYNLSYNDKNRREAVYQITGRPYGFFSSIKMGGSGSPPLNFISGPEDVEKIINQTYDRKYCNIELLRKGIIFRFKSRLDNYGLPIPITDIIQIHLAPGSENNRTGSEFVLEILISGNHLLKFLVKPHELPGIVKFFNKPAFNGKFSGELGSTIESPDTDHSG